MEGRSRVPPPGLATSVHFAGQTYEEDTDSVSKHINTLNTFDFQREVPGTGTDWRRLWGQSNKKPPCLLPPEERAGLNHKMDVPLSRLTGGRKMLGIINPRIAKAVPNDVMIDQIGRASCRERV